MEEGGREWVSKQCWGGGQDLMSTGGFQSREGWGLDNAGSWKGQTSPRHSKKEGGIGDNLILAR